MQIKMFGALRKFSNPDGVFEFHYDGSMTVAKFKTALAHNLSGLYADFDPEVLKQSAIATQQEILGESVLVPSDHLIAVLPPVCGG